MTVLKLLAPCLCAALCAAQNPNVASYLAEAEAKLAAHDLVAARRAVDAALERDTFHLGGLDIAARIALAQGDKDAAVHFLHELVAVARQRKDARSQLAAAEARLATLDETAGVYHALVTRYVREILQIAAEHEKRKRFHAALALFAHAREVAPHEPAANLGVARIRKTGGADVAVADVYAGGDPTFGKSEEWVAAEDEKHADWDQAWTFETDNYKYRTNAGYRVLRTAAIAMENVNQFYRRFFDYKTEGQKIAKIEIRIFKNRDEYLKLGRNPVKWSAGHFIGNAVETYVGGVTGNESIRRMYGTLFHEAAHHFVSLTSPRCPGWLNEAFASFFEGCEILSNGAVRWNRVPNHRLFPLAARIDRGWMADPSDGIAADGTGSPERAPTFRMVVEGNYRWGPPWYAPTWGVVYFLHNYRDATGRLVFRKALRDYYYSFKGRRPRDAVAHFEELVLGVKGTPAKTLDDLNAVWKNWILALRDEQQGKTAKAKSLVQLADARLEKKDRQSALELLEEAYLAEPRDIEVLWRLARLLETMRRIDRAAALYRDLASELEQRGLSGTDARYETAADKARRLDPLTQRYERLVRKTAKEGITLARSYVARGLPTTALEITKQLSAQFAVAEALDLYRQIARSTGKTLARWKLAYNERNLRGWSDDGNQSYRAYGREIRAAVKDDPSQSKKEGAFTTRSLTCDVTFEGDYSLESELWVEAGTARILGLCFGRKDTSNFHALILHPKGYLDLSANHGGVWDILDHRQVSLDKGWHRLRIDVAGKNVDFYLDGLWLRSYAFKNAEVARGSFGLITGVGKTAYRNVRLLARDPHDPAARIERELAMERIKNDASLRAPGTFAGFAPPPLDGATWVQGTPFDPRRPGLPALLFFWSPRQEQQLPTLALAKELAKTQSKHGIRVALVAARTRVSRLRSLVAQSPTLYALSDPKRRVHQRYGIRAGGFGLPRAVLVDLDGRVLFEGDLGLKIGSGWKPGRKTYIDGPIAKLVAARKLDELVRLAPTLATAKRLLRGGELGRGVALLRPLAALPAAQHPGVAEARRTLKVLEAAAPGRIAAAQAAAHDYPLRSSRELDALARAFPKTSAAKAATAARAALRKTRAFRLAAGAAKQLDRARALIAKGGSRDAIAKLIARAKKASRCREILELAAALERR